VLLTAAEGNPEGEAAAAECGVPVSAVDKIDGSVTILGASGAPGLVPLISARRDSAWPPLSLKQPKRRKPA
jgi:hypothetical protein